ncbi:MAG: flagellar basal body rod modification protein [Firmicutes bacterium ADurb.Bin419]|nr:MAG: flagellar basal body rod modification protein [Firmicutes bacterium ADurb.Bin419]
MGVSSVGNQKTIQQIIDETSASKTSSRNTGELGKDEFLSLLITQLQYQDPLNPQEDKEFIAQMAQFSALEQMQNLNSSYSATQAFALIGKTISANLKEDGSGTTNLIQGEVTGVRMQGGKAFVVVNNQDISLENVLEINNGYNTLNDSNLSEYTGLIGYDCSGYVYDPYSGEIVKVNGVVKEINKGAYENYAVMDGVTVNVAAIDSSIASVDRNYRKTYLENNIGREVSLIISDSSGSEVPVTAILKDFNVTTDGKVTAVLDGLKAPVDGITNIRPAKVQSEPEEKNKAEEETNVDETL